MLNPYYTLSTVLVTGATKRNKTQAPSLRKVKSSDTHNAPGGTVG